MESGNAEDDEESTADKDYDCLYSETGIILEDEEEYDVFNNETFGGPLPGQFLSSFLAIVINSLVDINLKICVFQTTKMNYLVWNFNPNGKITTYITMKHLAKKIWVRINCHSFDRFTLE